jgi:hypothetical protein
MRTLRFIALTLLYALYIPLRVVAALLWMAVVVLACLSLPPTPVHRFPAH